MEDKSYKFKAQVAASFDFGSRYLTIRAADEEAKFTCDDFPAEQYEVTLRPLLPEIKPCPFCKSPVVEVVSQATYPNLPHSQDRSFRVTCYACGSCGSLSNTEIKAIAKWNRHAG